ncbi:MAG: DUF4260 domain-containing protein [Solibacillus sp.]|uniref:DUF4260 domain-containing protein n=1 Tax=unclassified Solibacillus TaxID=2637870 RepID=UPI0031015329
MNKTILHIEYGLAFLVTLLIYWQFDFSWWLFIVLLFAPDLTMIGYAINHSIGASIYNIGHSLVIPIILLGAAIVFALNLLFMISCIWLAHIFMDRCLGYGLKYKQGFTETHMQRV